MSTFGGFTPKYDFGFGVSAPKPIASLMREHKRRNENSGGSKRSSRRAESAPSN